MDPKEDAQQPKTPRRIRNQDYYHLILVEIRSGVGPGMEWGQSQGE